MKKWVRGLRAGGLVAALGLLLAATGCAGAGGPTSGADAGGDRIRLIKASRSLSTLPLLYSLEKGYFMAAGVDVQSLPDANTSTQPIQALLAGQADMVQVGATAVFGAQAAGQDVVSVGIPTPGPSYQVVLSKAAADKLISAGASPRSPIAQRVQALKGLTFATAGPGSITDSLLRATLNEYGLNADRDVTLRAIPDPTAMVAALRQGQIDGFDYAPPFTSSTVADGTATLWVDFIAGDVPKFAQMPAGALVTTKQFAQAHPQAVKNFLKGLQRGYDDLSNDPVAAEQFMAGTQYFTATDPQLFKAGFQAYAPAYKLGPRPTEQGFDALLEVYNGDPSIKTKSTATFAQIFDLSYLGGAS
jgi:NitT/TauT family transport system substrate-binding protein